METNEVLDELLKQLLGDEELLDDVREGGDVYGVGKWPDAVLESVTAQDKNEFGYQITLKFDLAGIGGGRPFTVFQAVPDIEEDEVWQDRKSNNLASIMHAGNLVPKGKKFPPINGQARYDKLVAIFQTGIGSNFPLNITARKDKPGKTNVWGLTKKGA